MGYQTMAVFSITSWTLIVSFFLLKIIDVTLGLRVSAQEEAIGSDIVEHGVRGFHYDKYAKELGSCRATESVYVFSGILWTGAFIIYLQGG